MRSKSQSKSTNSYRQRIIIKLHKIIEIDQKITIIPVNTLISGMMIWQARRRYQEVLQSFKNLKTFQHYQIII